jgi:hypothetical protein
MVIDRSIINFRIIHQPHSNCADALNNRACHSNHGSTLSHEGRFNVLLGSLCCYTVGHTHEYMLAQRELRGYGGVVDNNGHIDWLILRQS